MYIEEIENYYTDLRGCFEEKNKQIKVLFIEDYSDDAQDKRQINLQFFRITLALGLSSKDYSFVSSSGFNEYISKNPRFIVVFGDLTATRLDLVSSFKEYQLTHLDRIIRVPSSLNMIQDSLKKKEGWQMLKKIKEMR